MASASGSDVSLKLISLISWPTSGVPLEAEKPKSPSSVYNAAPRFTGPNANEFGTNSMEVKEESAASSASGAVTGCGGKASTLRIGRSSCRIWARLAAVQLLGGFAAGTHRSSDGPPTGLNTAWVVGRKP